MKPAAEAPIEARPVPSTHRMLMQPKYFGPAQQMLASEKAIFDWMGRLCADYKGGHWEFYELSNGGFVMTLDSDQPIEVVWAENYTRTTMSRRAASITASLFAYAHLHSRTRDDRFADLFRNLREYASTLAESELILAAID